MILSRSRRGIRFHKLTTAFQTDLRCGVLCDPPAEGLIFGSRSDMVGHESTSVCSEAPRLLTQFLLPEVLFERIKGCRT